MRCCGLGLVALVCGCLDTNPLFVDPTEVSGDNTGQATGTTVEPTSTPGPTSDTDSSTSSPGNPTNDSASTLGDDDTGPVATNVDTTASSDTETPAECGNEIVEQGEMCDDGNDVNNDACLNDCTLPVCGDMVVQGYEACDDGNMDNTDDCPSCALPMCGDGHVFLDGDEEQCDDGNPDETDSCDNTCQFTKKYIFASSIQYSGDLGGMAGADMKCMGHATLGGLPGEYLAWLGDSQTSPAERMNHHPGPYILPSFGEPVVAFGWDDLTDGTLEVAIESDEEGNSLLPTWEGCNMTGVWTNTDTAGNAIETMPMNTCKDWTLNVGAGWWGSTIATDEQWTKGCFGDICALFAPIICVQQ